MRPKQMGKGRAGEADNTKKVELVSEGIGFTAFFSDAVEENAEEGDFIQEAFREGFASQG